MEVYNREIVDCWPSISVVFNTAYVCFCVCLRVWMSIRLSVCLRVFTANVTILPTALKSASGESNRRIHKSQCVKNIDETQ